jgi:hypothetical protein
MKITIPDEQNNQEPQGAEISLEADAGPFVIHQMHLWCMQ